MCSKKVELYKYSDDQLLVMSLIPYNNGIHDIDEKQLEYLSNSEIICDNKEELINELEAINKKKQKKCKYCNTKYVKLCDLRKHLIEKCFYEELSKRINDTKEINNQNIITINNENNIDNTININNCTISNNNNNNIINNNNIYLNIKHPIPFDDNWDISKIDDKTKMFIVFNKLMYTTLLDEILKNDTNLNVIIDKKADSGIVYKNESEEYIEMKLKDIINKSMEKLEKQLHEINIDVKNYMTDEYHIHNRRMITKKYNDYNKDDELQSNVINCMSHVYNKKKIMH
jgi:hypothetical protein